MIKINRKDNNKTFDTIQDQDFRIDQDKIYGKDEFGNEVYYSRQVFYAIKDNSLLTHNH